MEPVVSQRGSAEGPEVLEDRLVRVFTIASIDEAADFRCDCGYNALDILIKTYITDEIEEGVKRFSIQEGKQFSGDFFFSLTENIINAQIGRKR